MVENEIPTHCEECGGEVRLRVPLEASLADGKVWRCRRGCTHRQPR